jgi:hypothetical protein
MGRCIALLALTLVLAGCTNYGTKLEFNKGEIYYTEKVTEAEARKLGNFLLDKNDYKGEKKTIQLTKEGNVYQIRGSIKEELINDTRTEQTMAWLCARLSKVAFDNNPVEFHITDESMKTVKVVKMATNTEPIIN